MFIFRELSSYQGYRINSLEHKFDKLYKDNLLYFTQYIVRIQFPLENIFIICPLKLAFELPVVSAILKGDFKERAIDFQFIDKKLKGIKCFGPKLIILAIPSASIILKNGKALTEMFSKY